jgi:hypothetical protein
MNGINLLMNFQPQRKVLKRLHCRPNGNLG